MLTRNKFNKCLKILLSNSCLCSIVIIRSFDHFVAWIEEKWITKWFNKKALEKEFMTQKYWNEKMQNYFKVWKGIIILEIFCYSYDCYKILKRKNIFGIIFYFPVKKNTSIVLTRAMKCNNVKSIVLLSSFIFEMLSLPSGGHFLTTFRD